MKFRFILGLMLLHLTATAQSVIVKGHVVDASGPVAFVNIAIKGTNFGTASDESGNFEVTVPQAGTYTLIASSLGYQTYRERISINAAGQPSFHIVLLPTAEQLDETVITGTLKAVKRSDTPVPVEVYSPAFLRKNPTANVFEALQNVNGVRPQINCNVCNTGDIHINGLEGPYTLVLIDGMPIVSGLGTVYGLTGIPNSLIEQIEIVKGPASSLYGSEAVGGLINIITKNSLSAPEFFADAFATGWGEYNVDAGGKIGIGKGADLLLGLNYFNYDTPVDNNGDNFTDLTLQHRISIFQKWDFKRPKSRILSLAGRVFYEDRWGGEMQWTPEFRGTDLIYGESIYTRRWEVLMKYQLPFAERMLFSFSYNDHSQNSVYGDVPYLADQRIGFGQLTWDKSAGMHDMLGGLALRYSYYDDNTTATAVPLGNAPDQVWIPGIFFQDELRFSEKQSLLLGLRYDYDNRHGSILTPRIAWKLKWGNQNLLRLNAGSGFRVVNLFTEEHAALTGAREVIIEEALEPERSWNINLNFLKKIYSSGGWFANLDFSAFYTRFGNQILPDYDTNPNQIIYRNLEGSSVAQGLSANLDFVFPGGLKILAGVTLQDVSQTDADGVKSRQILTENFSGTWALSYEFRELNLSLDYTGNIYGPMRLPLLGELDPRREFSPVWSIQNIQFTYKGFKGFELYGGIKNLLDWTPNQGNPFLIARANDPFDKDVTFDSGGNPISTPDNPYALTFDPTYVYAPNQGIRGFAGIRYRLN